jgi:hypothetical protein
MRTRSGTAGYLSVRTAILQLSSQLTAAGLGFKYSILLLLSM